MKIVELLPLNSYLFTLTLLHSERPKLYTVLAFLNAIGLKLNFYISPENRILMVGFCDFTASVILLLPVHLSVCFQALTL